ncbi:hypothetical protein K435DRAFT_646266 [Dendrothele bispora CBS 962.96]|uniref:Nucleolar 27S pre-rRNA processing Urb2/Npa2 C-terminal domain-containing protein n=1 Tax=Dendrothele bispora (strain CBS 962.96) TaxID=1314807 RepID=A0A4S8MS47_DENBC|nr:hypothetical protein K435DRAFT_646266 [Dendrothele bispora CBS 962.96]
MFGRQLIKIFALTPPTSDEQRACWAKACSSVFDILLEDFHIARPESRDEHLEIAVAVYILLYNIRIEGVLDRVDRTLSVFCHNLSIQDFTCIVNFVCKSLSQLDERSKEIIPLVHLATILMRDPPRSICLNIFNARSNLFADGSLFLRLNVLEFVATRCRDRPVTLRLPELSSIWVLITKMATGSTTHDQNTSVETFYNIISIASSLIRLRRDLVVLTIPHLGMVLRRLILSMKSPRTNLGARQSAIISKDLPIWVNASQPFGGDEGKALARLFESLATKTIPRTHVAYPSSSQKAESLAKPFSKHAAYVLKAYVQAVNDSLSTLPSPVRKELQPGLYALGGMMGDYARDALMASTTDAGEKTTLKQLWQEYEKQKYIGKG